MSPNCASNQASVAEWNAVSRSTMNANEWPKKIQLPSGYFAELAHATNAQTRCHGKVRRQELSRFTDLHETPADLECFINLHHVPARAIDIPHMFPLLKLCRCAVGHPSKQASPESCIILSSSVLIAGRSFQSLLTETMSQHLTAPILYACDVPLYRTNS